MTVRGLTAKWSEATEENTLTDLTCCVKAGELLAVIGPVGSGKVNIQYIPFYRICQILLLLLLLLSDRLQTPTDRAKCHKPEGTSREGNPKKEKINKNEGKKDKNTL